MCLFFGQMVLSTVEREAVDILEGQVRETLWADRQVPAASDPGQGRSLQCQAPSHLPHQRCPLPLVSNAGIDRLLVVI